MTIAAPCECRGLTLFLAIDYINSLETQNTKFRNEIEQLRQKQAEMELRMKEMAQMARISGSTASFETGPPPPNNIGPMFGVDAPRTLPPLVNGAMQGVQYSEERR